MHIENEVKLDFKVLLLSSMPCSQRRSVVVCSLCRQEAG